ncbi:unnamed protein product [Heligmosomoides polygyrus]|uniref:CBS domain-containing protein n=1 Tax=Heligmosomoides polygyrus TaxID=6339 RepID=A0A183GIA2_HELPZ|nr:unnamed protein product [Heligmosomoides polygyrus]
MKEELKDGEPPKKVGQERRESRFTVLPAGKVPEPPTPRRNSLTRRNAFCSLETYTSEPAMGLHVPMTSLNSANRTGQAASLELEQEEDTKSMGSNEDHGQKHHLSLHNMTDYHTLVKSYMKQAKKYLHYMQFGYTRQEKQPMNMYDLSHEEKTQWETARLKEEVDLTEDIDPAPFQLVKKTSLFKIHSIFSMLQLSKVYVTEGGRLIGVVALSDVRHELERSQERAHKGLGLAPRGSSDDVPRPKISSCSMVVDILTPTLEVCNFLNFMNRAIRFHSFDIALYQ